MIWLGSVTTRRWGLVDVGGGGRGGGLDLSERVKRGYRGCMGDKLINDACCVSHYGFFCGNERNLDL